MLLWLSSCCAVYFFPSPGSSKLPIRVDGWVASTQAHTKLQLSPVSLQIRLIFSLSPGSQCAFLPLHVCSSNLPSSTSSSLPTLLGPFFVCVCVGGGVGGGDGSKQCRKRQQCLKLGGPGYELVQNVECSPWNMVDPH